MRPIGFHTVPRRLRTVGQRVGFKLLSVAFLIAGAVASVFFSPFILGGWISERLQRRAQR